MITHRISLSLWLGLLVFAACSSNLRKDTSPVQAQPNTTAATTTATPQAVSVQRPPALTHEMAIARAKQVAHVFYTLWFGLEAEKKEFKGRTIVRFELKPNAKNFGDVLELDFEGGSLLSLNLNGTNLTDFASPQRFDGHHIYFRIGELANSNRLEISYSHEFSTDGDGFHRFQDPSDGKVYVYTNFEPYSAHRLFPCFDQPDLKAPFELTVEAPKDWEVISNNLVKDVNRIDGRKSWAFPPTSVFSTYLFALHAGPFHLWKGDANGIPLRLFARKSIAEYVKHEEWLDATKKGLDFFNVQFGFPYPFGKYDQIIVPEFNSGAMENIGAVTFSERFVSRTRTTRDFQHRIDSVILHEMAHMWFGDLVTMRWWNGLWLNESFATFMSSWAADKAVNYKSSWQSFFREKQHAYAEDQLVTTHPIEVPIPDTESAQANFDSITYAKGASTLRQLSFYLGEDDFREGLQRYFQKYAFHNTTITDFFKMLGEASGKDLAKWQHAWVQTAGANTLEAKWACETDPETQKSKITQFNLIQGLAGNESPASGGGNSTNELRPHRTQLALFIPPQNKKEKPESLLPKEVLKVTYSAAQTPVSDLIGKPCPEFVLPNFEDYDYAKTILDPVSLKWISKHLMALAQPFARQMIWHTLKEMVFDGQMRAQDYADMVLKFGGQEKDTLLLSSILNSLHGVTTNQESILKIMGGELRNQYHRKIEDFIRTHLDASQKGSDQQLILLQHFLEVAITPKSVQYARSLLTGKSKIKGIVLDQERRWNLIKVLARNGEKDASELISKELKTDTTEMGQRFAIAAGASIPDADSKALWFKQIIRSKEIGKDAADSKTTSESAATQTPAPAASPSAAQEAPESGKSASPTPTTLASSSPTPTDVAATTPTKAITKASAAYEISKDPHLSPSQLREAIWNYNILEQEDTIRAKMDIYFETVVKLGLSPSIEDSDYAKWFTTGMYPSLCDPVVIQKTTALLEKHTDLPAGVLKSLKIGRQREERCIRARARAQD